jgi:hypothetical protein
MMLVSTRRTMASAKQVVPDPGINLRPRGPRFYRGPVRVPQSRAPQPVQRVGIPSRARQFIEMVAFWHEIEPHQILGYDNTRKVAAARHDAVAAAYENCNGPAYKMEGLARIFRRDHATIRNSLKRRGVL